MVRNIYVIYTTAAFYVGHSRHEKVQRDNNKKKKTNMEVECVHVQVRAQAIFFVCLLLAAGALDGSLVSTAYEKCEVHVCV